MKQLPEYCFKRGLVLATLTDESAQPCIGLF
ncbi:hypothetical protein CKAH01_18565 [Colletotrichum kahawae]|uniref:Uncharacterized protein n=1 Tax=Colletotrichum kahawae TaxID=34407 RepID=A0AAD9Y8B2_COLKA|nr:hypothetical protein CKAH01_18565 [Colletotrichum kahawae]